MIPHEILQISSQILPHPNPIVPPPFRGSGRVTIPGEVEWAFLLQMNVDPLGEWVTEQEAGVSQGGGGGSQGGGGSPGGGDDIPYSDDDDIPF